MEGGFLPWKNQKLVNDCPSVEYFTKSLPPPPSGQFWERDLEGNWKLVPFSEKQMDDGAIIFPYPSIIEHTIMPNDTLQGLCLKYRASAVEIRRMNMFSGNNIQMKTKLLIPINAGVSILPQVDTEELLLQKFKNVTHEETKESILYLEEHSWNLENALSAWKIDNQWEVDELNRSRSTREKFSAEIEDVVAPLAVEEAPLVMAAAVSFTPPSFEEDESYVMIPRSMDSKKKSSFFLFRPLLRK